MIGIKWRAPDGRMWDLVNGPVTLANASGLRGVPFSVFVRESAVVDGQSVTGWKANPRPVVLALDIVGTSAASWEAIESSVMAGFRPDAYGTLFVTGPAGATRRIDCRLDESEDQGDEVDPSEDGGSRVVVPLIADQPFYRGRSRVIDFRSLTLDRLTYPGPPFYFPSATADGETTLSNEGDVDAHGLWKFRGPIRRFEIEVADGLVAGDIDVPEGATLQLDTGPRSESLVLTNPDGSTNIVTNQLESIDFRAIPHGGRSRARVRVYGSGPASVTFAPNYFRAW